MEKTISPFANESESLGIGDLTIENRTDRISIYGNIDLTRDKSGLEHARMLKAVLDESTRNRGRLVAWAGEGRYFGRCIPSNFRKTPACRRPCTFIFSFGSSATM